MKSLPLLTVDVDPSRSNHVKSSVFLCSLLFSIDHKPLKNHDLSPSILPKDPYDRATARFWANFIDQKGGAALWKACRSEGEEREKAKEEAMEALKFLEDEIKDKKFFGGDNIGLVDFVANSLAYWLVIAQEVVGLQILTPEKFPNLWKWIGRYCSDPLVKDHLPDKEKLIALFNVAFATGCFYD